MRVLRKIKVDGKWDMFPVRKVDGKYDWSMVVVRGVPTIATEGTFHLEYRDGKIKRPAVGTHPSEAKAALASQIAVLQLRKRGVETDDAPEIRARLAGRNAEGKSIAEVVKKFKASPPLKLRERSVSKYTEALDAFARWAGRHGKTHVSQIDREDIQAFMSHLVRKDGLEMSTAVDKAVIAVSTMRAHGARIEMLRGDWPQVTEKQPEVYRPETLTALFAAMDQREKAVFKTFLLSGFREQEVAFLAWPDLNPLASTLTVSKKPALGFDPKNYQERTIPVPQHLVDVLLEHRKTLPEGSYLMFPTTAQNRMRGTPGGQRDLHMLAWLKRIAKRAGLNCGRCVSTWRHKPTTCAKHPVCTNFTLHMFRHTYATSMLHDGMDIVSLQKQMGHKDIASTMKYLRMLVAKDLLVKVNASSLAQRFL